MKGICQDTTPILSSYAGYREKRSHNRMIDSHWALKHIDLNTFNATYEGRFSTKCLMPFHIFRHWIADVKKKTSITLDQAMKKRCDIVQRKWKQAGWAPQIHNQYLQSQALISPWTHFTIHCILLRAPEEAQSHIPKAKDAMHASW